MPATVTRQGEVLAFTGPLERPQVAALWRQAQPLRAGATALDVHAVTTLDSAGLAFLAELAAGLPVRGEPPGLLHLRAAYRLDESLQC